MTKYISVLAFNFLFVTYINGQDCNCESLFLQTQKTVEENYAGWFDKINNENKSNYNGWTSKHLTISKKIKSDSICAIELKEWLAYFKDKHLQIKYTKPKSIVSAIPEPESNTIQILATNLSESQINEYFAKTKNPDPIEGIYQSSSYKLGVTKIKPNLFYATIISTVNENWKPGEVKLTIKKIGTQYEGSFYEGDKSDISIHKVQVVDNILDFDIVFYEKILPEVKIKRDINEYEMAKDKYAPSLKFQKDVALWKFPSFQNNAYEQTKYLLKKYKDKLEKTPYWVLDLTDNSGGDYSIGMQLLPYIYTKPIIEYNREMRMTESNIAMWFNTFVKSAYDQLDDKTKKEWDSELDERKKKIGTMYNPQGKKTDTLTLKNTLPYPQKIALLINENTISSGELFTMVARQSNKVIVMGTNTGGMMDYGNIVQYKTTCPPFRIQIPLDRQLWLEDGVSVDKAGLSPDIKLGGKNWTQQAIKIIKK